MGWQGYTVSLRTLGSRIALVLGLVACGGAVTQAQIEVVEVGGYLDDASLAYIRDSITEAAAEGRQLLILQINSEAVVGAASELEETVALVADPPLPLVTWLGPAPAEADGGVEEILAAAPLVAIAPNTETDVTSEVEIPSIRQLVQELDGMAIGRYPPVQTITDDLPDNQEGVTTFPVTFTQPGLWHRFTHLGATPEGAFFFLVIGLTIAAFEFFALGPGLAAAVAAISLFLGAYGISVLPTNPWAVAAAVAATWLLAASYQKGGVLIVNLLGTALLAWSGFSFSSNPAVRPGVLGVIFAILAVLFFFLLALPAVGRARFSTKTIGREALVGQTGLADVDFDPDGVVSINGARWPATAHRAAAIKSGDPVIVRSVAGREVEVEKAPT
ncbi:hypothetical protein BH18ACT6_BH18ACT6_03490 [soil metagenome]